jgi:Kef-type K+ transport system membrane component KefB
MPLFFILSIISPLTYATTEQQVATHTESYIILWFGLLVIASIFTLMVNKLRQPAILGQIIIGTIIAILAHYNIGFFNELSRSTDIKLIAELGSLFLLFEIGLESDVNEIKTCSKSAFNVAIIGVVLPFALGYFIVTPFILKSNDDTLAFFIGSILAVTSTSISISVFKELKILKFKACQIVLAASVIDDITGLVLLSLVTAIAINGHADWFELLHLSGQVTAFLLVCVLLGKFVLPKLIIPSLKFIATGKTITTFTLVGTCMVLAWFAGYFGLAPIIGAFFAGLMLNSKNFIDSRLLTERTYFNHTYNLHLSNLIVPFGRILTPIFFIYAGMQVDMVNAFKPNIIAIAILISIIAIIGKSFCGIFLSRGINKLIVGFGMVPRGEIGIIFAITGLNLKIIDNDIFAALMLMIVITSIITPIMLSKIVSREQKV